MYYDIFVSVSAYAPPEQQTSHARDHDLAGFYGHLKTVNVEGKQTHISQVMKKEKSGKLFKGVELNRK